IDPSLSALPPLPDTSDNDLTDGPTIAKACGYTSAPKVAGSHQKDKGKQCAVEPSSKGKQCASKPSSSWKCKVVIPSSDEDEDEPDSKQGRPRGAGNYNNADTAHLLDLVEAEHPLGQKGWLTVGRWFNIWAPKNGRPDRTPKSIKTKFKQLAKTTMPTRDGYCPPEVKRAHAIELLINEHACTRDLDDDDFDGGVKREHPPPSNELGSDDDLDNDEIEIINTPAPKVVHGAVVRRPDPLSSRRKSRVNSLDLVSKLTDTFDPAAVKARDAERAERSFSNTQFITLSQQLRNYQNTNETLHGQVTQLQDHLHEAEHAWDCFELQLDMHKLTQSRGPDAHSYPKWTREYIADHRDGHTRFAKSYPDGGYSTYWVTDPSNSEKENEPPHTSSSCHRHSCSRRHRPSPRGTSPWLQRMQQENDEEAYMSIRPPSPFHSAMWPLGEILHPPHFTSAADSSVLKDDEGPGACTQEEGGDNENKD
ncbi:hypothetical protein DXG01_009598, partial [Tephrocybe rancida]